MGGQFAYWGFQVSVPFHQIDCKCSSVKTFLSLKATGQYKKDDFNFLISYFRSMRV